VDILSIFPCLQVASSLETLRLSRLGSGAVKCVIGMLAILRLTCPVLSYVDLSSTDAPGEIVKRLVESRLRPDFSAGEKGVSTSVQIGTLVLNNCPNIEPKTLSWLRAHVNKVTCSQLDGHEGQIPSDNGTDGLRDRNRSTPFASERRIHLLHDYVVLPGGSAPQAIPPRRKRVTVNESPARESLAPK